MIEPETLLITGKILLSVVSIGGIWCVYDCAWVDSKLYFWIATILILCINVFYIWLIG